MMQNIDFSAILLSLFILTVNFLAYVFIMPMMFVAPDNAVVIETAWSFAYASTIILSPFILILGVIYPGILRKPQQETQHVS